MADKSYKFKRDDDHPSIGLPMAALGIMLLLILLIGGGILYLFVLQKSPVTIPVNLPNTTNVTNVSLACDSNCVIARAYSNKNVSDCKTLAGTEFEQPCYEKLSNISLDACTAVGDQTKLKACLIPYAVAKKSIGLCDFLVGAGKTDCLLAVDPCTGSKNRPSCLALLSSNVSECNSNINCILNFSITKHDSSSCKLIPDEVLSYACISSALLDDKCNALSLESSKNLCYQLYATYTNDYLQCSMITPGSSYALDCYSYFAAKRSDLSLCNSFSLDQRWACYKNYSLLSGDISGCKKIDSFATTSLFKCTYEFAIKYGDASACEVLGSTIDQKKTCYQGVMIYVPQALNWTKCAGVIDDDWRDKCYIEAAKHSNDITICEYLSGYAKGTCIASYTLNKNATNVTK